MVIWGTAVGELIYRVWYPFCQGQLLHQESLMGDFSLVGVVALHSRQCFDTVGWATGRASGLFNAMGICRGSIFWHQPNLQLASSFREEVQLDKCWVSACVWKVGVSFHQLKTGFVTDHCCCRICSICLMVWKAERPIQLHCCLMHCPVRLQTLALNCRPCFAGNSIQCEKFHMSYLEVMMWEEYGR